MIMQPGLYNFIGGGVIRPVNSNNKRGHRVNFLPVRLVSKGAANPSKSWFDYKN
jgi:hypothetical protein